MNRPPVLAGSLLVVVGLLLLLDELGQLDATELVTTWWPVLVIVAGLARLIRPPRSAVTGTLLVVVGGVLLAWRLELVDDLALVWPVSLLLVGSWLLLGRPRTTWRTTRPATGTATQPGTGPATPVTSTPWSDTADTATPGDRLDAVTVFSDRRLQVGSGAFRGGSVVTVFGDIVADLTTTLERTAVVGGVTVFGDVDLLVPWNWHVTSSGFTLFGDVAIDPPLPRPGGGGGGSSAPPELHLDLVTIFGDLTVRRASATAEAPVARSLPTAATTDA